MMNHQLTTPCLTPVPRGPIREETTRTPNFFIVGAPKCGTTAMHEYLGQHPQVFMSRIKEPHFFCSDFPEYRSVRTAAEYAALFAKAADERVLGESSVFYLYSATAVREAIEFAPDAKFLVMLRNPLDMLPSLHAQLVYSFREDELDFDAAWQLQKARAENRQLPKKCLAPEHLQYGKVASFAQQLRRVFDFVDRRSVHVVIYDDFSRDVAAEYARTLEFLDLPPFQDVDFAPVNQHKTHRWPVASRLLARPPEPFWSLKKSLKKTFGVHEMKLSKLLYRSLSSQKKRHPLSAETRDQIISCLRGEVEDLQDLLGRNLSQWGFFGS